MKKGLKKALKRGGVVCAILLAVLILAGLFFYFNKPLVKNISEHVLADKTGLSVEIGKLTYTLSPLRCVLSTVTISQQTPIQEMTIVLERLEAYGSFMKLIRGRRPVFETVEAIQADIHFKQTALSEEPFDYGQLVLQLADALDFAERISIDAPRVAVVTPTERLSLQNMNLILIRDDPPGSYAYEWTADILDAAGEGEEPSFKSRMSASGTLALGERTRFRSSFGFDSLRLAIGGQEKTFETAILAAAGEWSAEEGHLALSEASLRIPGLGEVLGSLSAESGEKPSFTANAEIRIDDLETITDFLRPHFPENLQTLRARGRTTIEGDYVLAGSPAAREEKLTASWKLDGMSLAYDVAGYPLQAEFGGALDFEGSPAEPRIRGTLRANFEKISGGEIRIERAAVSLNAVADKMAYELSSFDVSLGGLSSGSDAKPFSLDQADIAGKARMDIDRKTLEIGALEIRLPSFPPIRSTAALDFGPAGGRRFSLESQGIGISQLRETLSPFLPEDLAGWEADGRLDLLIKAGMTPGRPETWEFSGDWDFADGRFNDADFTVAGEGIDPGVSFEGTYDPAANLLDISGHLAISKGESLVKSFYISWETFPVETDLSLTLDIASRRAMDLEGLLRIPGIGEIKVGGGAEFLPVLSIDLNTHSRWNLGPFLSLFSQSGGTAGGGARIEGNLLSDARVWNDDEAFAVDGVLTWSGGIFENPEAGLALHDIQAEIPVFFTSGKADLIQREETHSGRGFFRAGELQTFLFTVSPFEMTLRTRPNALTISPLSLDVFGGTLELGQTDLRFDPSAMDVHGDGSLRLSDIDLSEIPVASPQFKLEGQASADFPVIAIGPERITTEGRCEVDIFGGKLTIRDLAVTEPFSEGRIISCDVDIVDLDLKRLTDSVPFGEVTGILRGEIRNLSFSYGQPSQFNLLVESVKKRGVPQTFSLKAVDNLTVISSGEQASMGTGSFWMRFIRGFRYEKLGIVSTLKNDTFTLNGTINEKGVEYLVKKPLLFGINVVNRMPEKSISFKEMVSRLKRVGQSEK